MISLPKGDNDLFLKISDFNPTGLIISNLETKKFHYVNENFLKIFGYTKNELIGKTAIDFKLIESDSNEKIVSLLKLNGFAKDIEVLARKKDGVVFCTLASAKIITIDDEKFTITSVQDINRIKK